MSLRLLTVLTCLAVAMLAVLAPLEALAQAAADAAPVTSVTFHYGELVTEVGKSAAAAILPLLVGVLTTAIYQLFPVAKLFITQARVEQMATAVTDYAVNAVEGATKGGEVTIPVGSAVIAKGVQRALDAAPKWLVDHVGGPQGVAELIFRKLILPKTATTANTLAPALDMIPAKAA